MTLKERIEEIVRNSGLSILAREYIPSLQINCEDKALTQAILKAIRENLEEIQDILAQPPDRISTISIEDYAQIRQRVLDKLQEIIKETEK